MDNRSQRWRERRDSFRRRGEAFDPSAFGVELVRKGPAADFVTRHHYAATMPQTSVRVGLYRSRLFFAPELVGVATFGTGASQASVPKWSGLASEHGLHLNRLVLLDEVEFNAETFFLARAFAALRAERPAVRVVLSYSDPVPRRDEAGRLTMPGHVGACYQAKGARFVGRTEPETKWLDSRGVLLDPRSLSKVRNEERGGESFERYLVALGAPVRAVGQSPREWLPLALERGPFVRTRHPGNLVYLFDPAGRANRLPPGSAPALPYVKKRDLEIQP